MEILTSVWVPPEEYNRIIGGDYELANTYLQKEIERKNRLLAFQLLKQEQSQFIIVEKKNICTEDNEIPLSASKCNDNVESTFDSLTQCTEDNVGETYLDNIEYSGSLTLSNTNELWPYNAVIALIASMAIHYADLSHPKKKEICIFKYK